MSLEAFGVKNLRCLVDTGLVPIRPITVLVGRNSSGKSTFLRTFPLLRQSVESRRSTPILWYGDSHPVDFGSLRDASSAWLSEPTVSFRFSMTAPKDSPFSPIGERRLDIEVTLAGAEAPYVSEYCIHVEEHEARWCFDSNGRARSLSVNDKTIPLSGPLCLGGRAHLLPTLLPGDGSDVLYSDAPPADLRYFDSPEVDADRVLLPPLVNAMRPVLEDSMNEQTLHTIATITTLGTRDALHAELARYRGEELLPASVRAIADDTILPALVARLSPRIIEVADILLADCMRRVAYLAPLRVTPQRAYRITNYAVDELEADGKNLAMFLRSLSPGETESFARFTRGALGFETSIRTSGIHAEILIRSATTKRLANLVDVGFGYSEVLPLAAVLWNSCLRQRGSSRKPVSIVAIEQPELHLHPAHQALLARMFVETVAQGHQTKIVIETHSESLINGLGRLVYDGEIKASDIQLVLFDQDEETERTGVRLAGYRDSGALYDWPYGFLSPVASRSVPPAAAE
ncbi:MAG: AAA family ATPase [Polyangiaceae bacterium]